MNIVNMAMSFIGPAIASKIASMLGINNTMVNRAIATALPAILAGFASKSSTSGGAGALMNMIRGQDSDQLGSLENIVGGSDAGKFVQSGTGMLNGLLGGDGLQAMKGGLMRQTGLNEAQSESIFGLLGPVATATLGNVVKEQGLDADGLARFMGDQKTNIADAIPREFASELQGTGLLDGFTANLGSMGAGVGAAVAGTTAALAGSADRTVNAGRDAVSGAVDNIRDAGSDVVDGVGRTADRVGDASRDAVDAVKSTTRSGMGFLPWVLVLALLGALAWYFLGRGEAPSLSKMGSEVSQSVGDLSLGGMNIGDQFNDTISGVQTSLGSVTDVDSARAALEGLQASDAGLGKIGDLMASAPAEAKSGVAGLATTAIGTLRPMIDKVLEIPGVGDVLRPVLDSVLARLEGLEG